MPAMPKDKSPESTLAFLLDPYTFISKRCRRYRSDLFRTRLLLQTTVCMTGRAAAELVCDARRFERRRVVPGRIEKTLFGRGGVQGLDDEAHLHRKRMFMSLMTPERVSQLADIADDWWWIYIRKWASMERVLLYPEVQEILCRAVCAWAGVPLDESDVRRRTRELAALFDQAGSIGPKHWWARVARWRAERWIAGLIRDIRSGRLRPPEESAAHVVAWHRELNGQLLHPRIAAVELLNVLRPTVAVSVYVTFVAHALHRHPELRQRIQAGGPDYAEMFVQEVRRLYPFFPVVGARTRSAFSWNGYRFPRGQLVLLDLYGTNHDARIWEGPDEFNPERFRQWDGDPYNFIPQGGGDHHLHHRCPGEWITIALMKVALNRLARLSYDVPPQDLRIDWSRLPALPRSRFVMSNVTDGADA